MLMYTMYIVNLIYLWFIFDGKIYFISLIMLWLLKPFLHRITSHRFSTIFICFLIKKNGALQTK